MECNKEDLDWMAIIILILCKYSQKYLIYLFDILDKERQQNLYKAENGI